MDFEYGAGATAYGGCGATLMGEFWYFGGGYLVSKDPMIHWQWGTYISYVT